MDFKKFSKLIMIEQTFFALPFALIGVLFAGGGSWKTWVLVIVAFSAARTAGMSFNRVIDAKIDAQNPRTADRLIPSGEVRPTAVWLIAITALLVLVGASYLLNELCFYLSFVAALLLFTYSYFKRFSSTSHFYLGLVEAAAPIGGYLAVTGTFSALPLVLGFIILAWIAGLDIVYALQDMDFDKQNALHSIPARIGRNGALVLSAVCYLFSIGAMVAAGIMADKGISYWVGIVGIGIIFLFQQRLARSEEVSSAVKRLFAVNAYISPILFVGTFIDVIVL
jgi:4-hydroxybenzoate polyprenyltransferase